MKILLLSDTHGDLDETRKIIKAQTDIDSSIHLGDIGFSLKELSKFHIVCGNHDKNEKLPQELILTLEDRKVLCIHGNRFDDETLQEVLALPNIHHEDIMNICMNTLYDKLSAYAKHKGCDTVFFGHTHHQYTGIVENVVIVNPGSVCFGTPNSGYAVVEIKNEEIKTKFYTCDEESVVDSL